MLSINREPLYKNKLLLSSLAVFSGFIVTVGIIRVMNPVNDTANQSTQTSNDRRASSLIPINASDSEKSSESDKTGASSSDTTASGSTVQPASGSTWIAPSATSSGTPASKTATAPTTSGSGSTSGSTSSAPTATQPSSTSGNTSGGSTATEEEAGVLDPVTCTLLKLC